MGYHDDLTISSALLPAVCLTCGHPVAPGPRGVHVFDRKTGVNDPPGILLLVAGIPICLFIAFILGKWWLEEGIGYLGYGGFIALGGAATCAVRVIRYRKPDPTKVTLYTCERCKQDWGGSPIPDLVTAAGAGPDAVEPLVGLLKDPHWDVRLAAADRLGMIRDPRAVEALLVSVQDSNKSVRRGAIAALGSIGDGRAMAPAVDLLGSTDKQLVRAAADALEKLGWTPPAGEIGERYWVAKQNLVQAAAATAGSGAANAAPAASAASGADMAAGPSAVSTVLADVPSDPNAAAAALIAYLRRKEVKNDDAAREGVVRALIELGPPALGTIRAAFFAGGDVQPVLHKVIKKIFKGPRPVEERIDCFKYPIPFVAGGLVEELTQAGPRVVEPLIAALRDDNFELRKRAAEVLGRIGDPRAAQPLSLLQDDVDPAVRSVAKKSLSMIQRRSAATR
jgi:HEAT repeat protein